MTDEGQSEYWERDALYATPAYQARKAYENHLNKVEEYVYKPYENATEIETLKQTVQDLKIKADETYNKCISTFVQCSYLIKERDKLIEMLKLDIAELKNTKAKT